LDKATETLEHMNHAAHADAHSHHSGMSTYIGITMAVLGVILAIASAKVGNERAELVKTMVEREDVHSRYVTQDLKHRLAVISLRQLRATLPILSAKGGGPKEDPKEMVALANTISRYYDESQIAAHWADAFNPVVAAHAAAQEYYEDAMLAAEIGIVIASVALLLRRRMAWYLSIALGVAAMAMIVFTYARTAPVVHENEKKIEEGAKEYRTARAAHKTTEIDQALVDEVLAAYGGKPLTAHE